MPREIGPLEIVSANNTDYEIIQPDGTVLSAEDIEHAEAEAQAFEDYLARLRSTSGTALDVRPGSQPSGWGGRQGGDTLVDYD